MKIIQAFKIGLKIVQARLAFTPAIPLSVYLSVTDRCAHACEYCNIPGRRLNELSTEAILSLIRQIKKAGGERLQIVGGEPLLRPDIGEIVDYAKEQGLYVTASSTGCYPEKIASIKKIDLLFLSFDGEESVHDRHKGQGTYRQLMETMKVLKKEGVPFWTTTVLTKMNKDSIDFILRTAREQNFLTVFQPLYYTGSAYENHFHLPKVDDKYVLANEDMRNIFKKLLMAKKKGAPIASSLAYFEYLLKWDDYQKVYSSRKDPQMKCWGGRLYCYIDTDGLLYPCGDSIGRVEGIDCRKEGFATALARINLNVSCQSCIIACDVEKNLIFSLNARTIMNWMRLCLR
jgi:MoaA/NifB/PqqE/SkfB family radical SAM enzyme